MGGGITHVTMETDRQPESENRASQLIDKGLLTFAIGAFCQPPFSSPSEMFELERMEGDVSRRIFIKLTFDIASWRWVNLNTGIRASEWFAVCQAVVLQTAFKVLITIRNADI